jgi:hypothetical protein
MRKKKKKNEGVIEIKKGGEDGMDITEDCAEDDSDGM